MSLAVGSLLTAIAIPAAFFGARSIGRVRGLAAPSPATSAILVTGCSTGIGRETVKHLAETAEVSTVFATVRSEKDKQSLLSQFGEEKRAVIPLLCDVTIASDVKRLREDVEKELASRGPKIRLTGIVNNAAILKTDPDTLDTADVLERTLATNLVGGMRIVETFQDVLTQTASEEGMSGAARVVFLGSYFGSFLPGQAALSYSASKYALEPLSDGLRRRLAPKGVHVALVKPGNIDTPMNQQFAEVQPSVVAEAISDALLSSAPRTRYYPGTFGGLPNRVACFLLPLLPDRWADAFWKRMLGGGDGE